MKLKVYNQNNSFIATLPLSGPRGPRAKRSGDPKFLAFKKYYKEARAKNVSKRDMFDHIFTKMFNDECSYLIDNEEFKSFEKKELNRVYQILKRYRRKLGFFRPNYFITFTYSDDLIDVDDFERKLTRVLNNLSYRNSWRFAGAVERGAENGRVHYHFLAYVPPGEMVGDLFLDKRWNKETRKYDLFTNNTFFAERFGIANFVNIEGNPSALGTLAGYLVKYIVKGGEKLIYSRYLPTEINVDVDLDKDVFSTFYDFSKKLYLSLDLFYSQDELSYLGSDYFIDIFPDEMLTFGYDPNVTYHRPCNA